MQVTSRTKTGDQSDPTPRQYYPANMTLHRGLWLASPVFSKISAKCCSFSAVSAPIFATKNTPALRARGLHMVELDTRACCALVIKGSVLKDAQVDGFQKRQKQFCVDDDLFIIVTGELREGYRSAGRRVKWVRRIGKTYRKPRALHGNRI